MGRDTPSCSATKTANPTQKRKTPVLPDLDTALVHLRRHQLAMARPVYTPSSFHQPGFGSPILLSNPLLPPSSSPSYYTEREEEEEEEPNTASGIIHDSDDHDEKNDDDDGDDDDDRPSSLISNNLRDQLQPAMASVSSTSFQGFGTFSEEPTTLPKRATQLTIFYNGNVHVFDNISPEKARAIHIVMGDANSYGTIINFSSTASNNTTTTTTTTTTATIKQNEGKRISLASMQEEPKQRIIPGDNGSMEEEKKRESTLTSINPQKNEANIPSKATISLKAQGLLHPRKISLARFISKRKEWMDHQGEGSNGLSSEEEKIKLDS